MNASVLTFETAYGDRNISLGLAIAINVSGRQRMLSQKMSEETCLCALGFEAEANHAALAQTARLFDLRLTALTDGLPTVTIIAPPTAAIADKRNDVAALWTDFKTAVNAVARAPVPTPAPTPVPADIAFIAKRNDALLSTMNDAGWLCERA
jgi:hypothetical protein